MIWPPDPKICTAPPLSWGLHLKLSSVFRCARRNPCGVLICVSKTSKMNSQVPPIFDACAFRPKDGRWANADRSVCGQSRASQRVSSREKPVSDRPVAFRVSEGFLSGALPPRSGVAATSTIGVEAARAPGGTSFHPGSLNEQGMHPYVDGRAQVGMTWQVPSGARTEAFGGAHEGRDLRNMLPSPNLSPEEQVESWLASHRSRARRIPSRYEDASEGHLIEYEQAERQQWIRQQQHAQHLVHHGHPQQMHMRRQQQPSQRSHAFMLQEQAHHHAQTLAQGGRIHSAHQVSQRRAMTHEEIAAHRHSQHQSVQQRDGMDVAQYNWENTGGYARGHGDGYAPGVQVREHGYPTVGSTRGRGAVTSSASHAQQEPLATHQPPTAEQARREPMAKARSAPAGDKSRSGKAAPAGKSSAAASKKRKSSAISSAGAAQPQTQAPAPAQQDIAIFPRRKAGQTGIGNNRPPVVVTLQVLEEHYHMPLLAVCKKLGLCATVLKKVCRQLGVHKWPYKEKKLHARRQDRLAAEAGSNAAAPASAIASRAAAPPARQAPARASGARQSRSAVSSAEGPVAARAVKDERRGKSEQAVALKSAPAARGGIAKKLTGRGRVRAATLVKRERERAHPAAAAPEQEAMSEDEEASDAAASSVAGTPQPVRRAMPWTGGAQTSVRSASDSNESTDGDGHPGGEPYAGAGLMHHQASLQALGHHATPNGGGVSPWQAPDILPRGGSGLVSPNFDGDEFASDENGDDSAGGDMWMMQPSEVCLSSHEARALSMGGGMGLVSDYDQFLEQPCGSHMWKPSDTN